MKVRKAKAQPCKRKGVDNSDFSDFCECFEKCQNLGGFLTSHARGTNHFKKDTESKFEGCLTLEKSLIDHQQLRYDGRETTGLDVLFNGVKDSQDFEPLLDGDSDEYKSLDFSDLDKKLNRAAIKRLTKDLDQTPKTLQMSGTSTNEILRLRPHDLRDAMLRYCWERGVFDSADRDTITTAYLMIKYKETLNFKVIQEIWPAYTDKAFQRHEKIVNKLIDQNFPDWAAKFESFMDSLTDDQREAISLEYFYNSCEKPSQEDLAAEIGIGVDAFKARLKLAYKKLESIYPEFERVSRRKKNIASTKTKKSVAPLYRIINGERIEIPKPKKRIKKLSPTEVIQIRKWAEESFRFEASRPTKWSQKHSGEIEDDETLD